MLKLKNDALRGCCRWSSSVAHQKQSVSRVKLPPPPARIMQPPPDWQTPPNGLFHPQREADHYAKQLEGTQKYINEQEDRCSISMGNSCNYCEQYTRASSGV